MREVEFLYVEVINETEQILIFQTIFNKQPYAKMITLNTALPVEMQDERLRKLITSLANMTREDASKSINSLNVQV